MGCVNEKPTPEKAAFKAEKKGFKAEKAQTFKPEKVTGGEIGLKSELADRQVTFNLTGYWYDYSDLQVTTYDSTARSFTTQNAAKARVKLGWMATTTLEQLCQMMVAADLRRVQDGVSF